MLCEAALFGTIFLWVSQPKIHDNRFTPIIEHDIGWFEVTMDHATAMGLFHRLCHFADDHGSKLWIILAT